MSGHDGWRPLTVAMLALGAAFLPLGVAVAAPPGGVSCARIEEQVRADRIECTPVRHNGVDGVFIGPVLGPRESDGGSRSPASTKTTGSARADAPPPTTGSARPPGNSAPDDGDADDGDAGDSDPDSTDSGSSGTTPAGTVPDAASCPATDDTAGSASTTPTTATGSVTVDERASDDETDTAATATTPTPAAEGNADLPSDVIDVGDWYLTLPTGQQGDPDTVENPVLATFTNEFFKLNPAHDGVVFSAHGAGATTKNSRYPRSELREMDGDEKAAWTNTSGTHTLDVCEAVTKVPDAKPEVVAAQIHDGKDDVMQIRLEDRKLMVQYDDGGSEVVIDPDYALGTPYHVRVVAANSKVEVHYNGEKKADLPLSGSGWYWKVGAYVQSNSGKGDGGDSVGEVTVYALNRVHAEGSR
jgi:hypothetical protein